MTTATLDTPTLRHPMTRDEVIAMFDCPVEGEYRWAVAAQELVEHADEHHENGPERLASLLLEAQIRENSLTALLLETQARGNSLSGRASDYFTDDTPGRFA